MMKLIQLLFVVLSLAIALSAQPLTEIKSSPKVATLNLINPTISPDGKRIAYEEWVSLNIRKTKICEIGKPLCKPVSPLNYSVNLTWIPTDAAQYIYVASPAGNLDLLSSNSALNIASTSAESDPRLHSSGKMVFTVNNQLKLKPDYKSAKVVDLTNGSNYAETLPVISPDGARAAFILRKGSNTNEDLAIIDLSAKSVRELTATEDLSETNPSFSLNGQQIAFYQVNSQKKCNLAVISANGGSPRIIVEDVYFEKSDREGPIWIDDQTLLYVKNDAVRNNPIEKVDLTAKRTQTLQSGTIFNQFLDLAVLPSGVKMLAFSGRPVKNSNYHCIYYGDLSQLKFQ